jgi:hypothetical protein
LVLIEVGVQDSHSAQDFSCGNGFLFRIFCTYGSGSPGLPLCIGLANLVMVLYFAFLVPVKVGVLDSHCVQAWQFW